MSSREVSRDRPWRHRASQAGKRSRGWIAITKQQNASRSAPAGSAIFSCIRMLPAEIEAFPRQGRGGHDGRIRISTGSGISRSPDCAAHLDRQQHRPASSRSRRRAHPKFLSLAGPDRSPICARIAAKRTGKDCAFISDSDAGAQRNSRSRWRTPRRLSCAASTGGIRASAISFPPANRAGAANPAVAAGADNPTSSTGARITAAVRTRIREATGISREPAATPVSATAPRVASYVHPFASASSLLPRFRFRGNARHELAE